MNSDLESLVKTNQVEEALAVATREASSAMDNVYVRVLQKYKERLHEMERATAAELKDNAEIDFIKQLPYDVVSQIVTYLWHATSDRDDESPAFLYVSKHWRRAILEATPYLFYRFSRGMHPDHTKDLVIALRSRIRRMGIDPAHTPFPQILGPNLVHLQHLRLDDYRSLDEIMELCPNLVSLKVLGCSLDDDNENQYQQLRVLALEDDGESEWIDLFAKLPCLVVLSILGFPDVDTLDTFSQHCPSLKYVKYNEAPDNWVRWPYVWDASLDSGIQGLWIGDYADDLYYDGEALNDALLRTSKTLKHFHLEWSLDNNARAVPPAREIVFSHLASLSGQVDSESLLGFLVSMIDKAPKLETINLNLTWIDPTPIILMSSYHRLVNVHLVMKEEDQALDPLKTFLDAHPLLRSLSIGLWTQQCVQELLPRITKLTLLDELNIEFGHGTPLTTIINSVGHEMNITRLTLTGTESLNSIEEPIFSGLRFARSLKSLVIMVGSLTNMAALSLIELPSKVHIQMPLDGLNASVVKVLSRRFMNMKELEET